MFKSVLLSIFVVTLCQFSAARADDRQVSLAESAAALKEAISRMDREESERLGTKYVAEARASLTKADIDLLSKLLASNLTTHSHQDAAFMLFLDNAVSINSLMQGGGTDHRVYGPIVDVIYEDEIASQSARSPSTGIMWRTIAKHLKAKYPELGEELVGAVEERIRDRLVSPAIVRVYIDDQGSVKKWALVKPELQRQFPDYDCEPVYWLEVSFYSLKHKRWAEGAEAVARYIESDGDRPLRHFSNSNSLSWYVVFEHSDDKRALRLCANLMRRIVDRESSSTDGDAIERVDTYANLLYKLGDRDEALQWERVALGRTNPPSGEISATIAKMQSGQPTWPSE